MKRISCVLIGLIFLFPCFLKAQVSTVTLWEREGETTGSYISFSPDSSQMIISGLTDSLKIFSTVTGEELRTYPFALEYNYSPRQLVAWSSRNEIALINSDGTLKIIDGISGTLIREHIVPSEFEQIVFSPSGQYLIGYNRVSEQKTKIVLDTKNYKEVNIPFPFDRITFLPGDTVALIEDGVTLAMRRFPSGEIIREFENIKGRPFFGFSDISIHYSGLAAVGNVDSLIIFNYASGEIVRTFKNNIDGSLRIAFSPDGSHIISMGMNLRKWNIASGQLTDSIPFVSGNLTVLNDSTVFASHWSFLGDGCYPYGFDNMGAYHVIDKIDVRQQKIYNLGHFLNMMGRMYFKENELITETSDSIQIRWESTTGDMIAREKVQEIYPIPDPALSSTGKYLLKKGGKYSNETLELWDNHTNTFITKLADAWYFHAVAFTPDEKYILVSLENFWDVVIKNTVIFEVATGLPLDTIQTECYLSSIVVSDDNQFIATKANDGKFVMYSNDRILTSIEDAQPENFLKTTIHPNPLQESGTISYSVSTPGLLKISVHDIFGREMMVVKNEFSEPGNYTIPFKSSELSGGTYFLKVTGGRETSTTHFSILR